MSYRLWQFCTFNWNTLASIKIRKREHTWIKKKKEFLIISLIWALGWLTVPAALHPTALFTQLRSEVSPDPGSVSVKLREISWLCCVWRRRLGSWGQTALSRLEAKRHLHYACFPWHLLSLGKTVLEKQCGRADPVSADLCLDEKLPSLFHPSAQIQWLTRFLSNLTLIYLWASQLLLSSSVRQITLFPLGNKRCILRATYAGPGLILRHVIRSQKWFLLG